MPGSTTRVSGSNGEEIPRDAALTGNWCPPTLSLVLLALLALVSWSAARAQAPVSGTEAAAPRQSQPTPVATAGTWSAPGDADSAAARAETLERLKEFDPVMASEATTLAGSAGSGSPSASISPAVESPGRSTPLTSAASRPTPDKFLTTLLQDRLRWLNEYDTTALALQKATHPEPSPEQQAADARAELKRLQAVLTQATTAPETLLPPLFRDRSVKVSSSLASEMKDAIETASNDLKDWRTRLEILRGEVAKWNSLMSARRVDRDRLFERVTTLTAKNEEFKSAVTDAQTALDRRLAHERLINFEWQLRVESLRLRVIEAHLALETRLSEVRDQRADVYRAHIADRFQDARADADAYHLIVEDQQRDLARTEDRGRKQGAVVR